MLTFNDIFRKSFLTGWQGGVGIKEVVVTLIITSLIAIYIFLAYRVMTKKTFYSKSFNISLAGVALITSAIIITIQSNIVVSLGMVGALSIVRFRTAIKDPMDLMFLFWAISVGIICGAGFGLYAFILSLALSLLIFILNYLPMAKAPMILVINSTDLKSEDTLLEAVKEFAKYPSIKSRAMTHSSLSLTIELRTNKESDLISKLIGIDGVTSATFLAHDGEVTF